MDRRNLKKPEAEKKTDKKDRGDLKKPEAEKKTDRKDRGDLKKPIFDRAIKKAIDSDTVVIKASHPDRGDSNRKLNKLDKSKPNVSKKVEEPKKNDDKQVSKENVIKKVERTETELALHRNIAGRDDKRKLKEKSTLKLKNLNPTLSGPVVKKEMPTIVKKDIPNVVKKTTTNSNLNVGRPNLEASAVKVPDHPVKKPSIIVKDKIDLTHATRDLVYNDSSHRKPIIKTITSKNDASKIYKAVTFVDQKKQTTIQVKLPDEYKNISRQDKILEPNNVCKKVPSTLSRVSLKEKVITRKKGERRRHKRHGLKSPDLKMRILSPPTEVAKWAPSSINKHTKPYYEAWVSTTLAAISKNSKKDKLFLEKQNILQSFQRALAERPDTPDLMYEHFNDERYTGRIKVKQR